MRIDAYNAVSQVYNTTPKYKSKAAGAYSVADDKFEISDTAKSYSVAKSAVAKQDDVRADKVARIKAQIEAGTYNISPEAIADKILDNMDTITF